MSDQGIDPAGSNGIESENIAPALVPRKDMIKPCLCKEALVEMMLEKQNVEMIRFRKNETIKVMSVGDHNFFYQLLMFANLLLYLWR